MTMPTAPDTSLNRRQQAEIAAKLCEQILRQRFGVREVYLVGSLAGETPWHSGSDIDLAVEGLAPDLYFSALTACWELLPSGMNLDLVSLETAPPELAAKAKQGMHMPQDNEDLISTLKSQIAFESKSLQRLIAEAKSLVSSLSSEPSSVELRALGSIVHDFYTACERIFEKVAVYLDGGVPLGESWHVSLLRSMESPFDDKRPAVIDRRLALRLLDYLRFRHLFRHSYGFELEWNKLQPLVAQLEPTQTSLSLQLDEFILKIASFSKTS